MAKKAKHSDAVMTGILVTKFQMGLIDVEDLEQMAGDTTRAERCSAAKKVLEAVRDSPDLLRRQDALLHQIHCFKNAKKRGFKPLPGTRQPGAAAARFLLLNSHHPNFKIMKTFFR